MILDPFLDGMKGAGASVELFYTKRLDIRPCTGELICWEETPGKCYISDDMQLLYHKLREADILVLATPVYMPLPGEMQNLMNRLVLLLDPILEMRAGRTRARFREDVRISKIALVSTCGWWEKGNFEVVLQIAEELARNASVDFAGALLRPHAYLLGEVEEKTRRVMDAARQAGIQLVKEGKMSEETLEMVSQPLVSEEERNRRYGYITRGQ